jgi:hypothetical protein
LSRDHGSLYGEQYRLYPAGGHKEHEKAVVSASHAGADPGTVMVEAFDAHIAVVAVGGARGPVDEAGGAKFNF